MSGGGSQRILVDVICLFLLVFSYVNMKRIRRYRYPMANGFVLANIFAVLFEMASIVSETALRVCWAPLLYFLRNGYICSALCATACWFLNSLYVTKKRVFEKRGTVALLLLPLACSMLLTLTTGLHRKVFYFDEAFRYVRGPWFVGFFSIAGIYLVCALILYIRAEQSREIYIFKNLNMFSALYTVVLLVCMVIQTVTKDAMAVINAACALTALMIHEDLQRKEITMDPLTELKNRNAINDNIQRILKSGKKERYAVLLDIDRFKQINDRFGHLEGDCALMVVADALRHEFDRSVFFGRYGGDEFLLLFDGKEEAEVRRTEERLNARITEGMKQQKKDYEVAVSAGILAIDGTMKAIPDVLGRVDEQLYMRKREKKEPGKAEE